VGSARRIRGGHPDDVKSAGISIHQICGAVNEGGDIIRVMNDTDEELDRVLPMQIRKDTRAFFANDDSINESD
jgi:hypothetical protein